MKEDFIDPTVDPVSAEAATAQSAAAFQPDTRDAAEAAIVSWLDKVQKRDVERDDGNGYRSARLIAQAVGMEKTACRDLLRSMAERQMIRLEAFANGQFWRSTKPLPWEKGGSISVAQEAEREAWKQPLTLIVQAVWRDRGHTMSRDEKAYPAALRDRAESHVQSANWKSDAQRRDDRANDCHLRQGYASAPEYRLISLSAAIAKAQPPSGQSGEG